MPYVNHRWLGGLLTNWRTMADRIDRLHEMRRLRDEGQMDLLPAKERIAMGGELEKLEANLGGVADMRRQPDAVVIVDLKKEALAVREARRLGIPVVALVDTNCDPDEADYVIPGNDDAIRSCNLVVHALAEAVNRRQAEGLGRRSSSSRPAEAARPQEPHERPGRRRRAGRAGEEIEPVTEGESVPVPTGEDPAKEGAEETKRVGSGPRRPDARQGGGVMAAEISAQLVRELREQTGAGMMDCKRALQETNGDMEAAVVLLREKGMASAAKRADRATTEGLVGYRLADDGSRGTMVAVGCETEPVSKNEEFQAFGKKALDLVEAEGIDAVSQLEDERVGAVRQARREHRRRRRGPLRGRRRRPHRRLRPPAREQARRPPAAARRRRRARAQPRDAHLVVGPALDRPRGRPRGPRRRGARDLPQLRRGAVEARAGA